MTRNSKKWVFGVGVKGDGITKINGKHTKAYTLWKNMLERCYNPKTLSKHPTYTGCSVCDAWLFFPTFNAWCDIHYVEDWELDKDLLTVGNKVYGPDTCVFAHKSINSLFTDHRSARGEYPIGVSLHKRSGKFRANLSIDGTLKYLGLFDTVEDASKAYLIAKKANVIRIADEWKEKIPVRLYEALIRKANDLI